MGAEDRSPQPDSNSGKSKQMSHRTERTSLAEGCLMRTEGAASRGGREGLSFLRPAVRPACFALESALWSSWPVPICSIPDGEKCHQNAFLKK